MSTDVLSQAIDPASDRAVYKQIADHLRDAIGRGRLAGGDQLPSEAQLMAHYGVARMIKVREEQPPAEVADRLKLGGRERAVVRSRRYLLDGRPVETAVSYIPADLAKGTPIADPNPGPGGIYARLEEQDHILERFTEEVSARMPTPEETRALNLPPGVPVFRLVRTAYDTDGRAVEVCDTIMAADAYMLAYELPAH